MKKTNDFGRDSVPLLVLKTSIPFMFAQFVNVLYSIVDRIYIGNIPVIGGDSLAGAGVCAPIITLLSSFACTRDLLYRFGGEVPRSLEDLTSLAGVGRKTANVIRGNIYHDPSVVVDTHVKRISRRLGLTKNEDPEKIETDLMKELPKDHWILYNIQIITFGRSICTARSPKCEQCFLQKYCKEFKM